MVQTSKTYIIFNTKITVSNFIFIAYTQKNRHAPPNEEVGRGSVGKYKKIISDESLIEKLYHNMSKVVNVRPQQILS